MTYGLHFVGYVGIVILVSAISSPTIFGEDLRSDFLTRSNQDITRLLFRNSVDNDTNYIFSPFGYSMILGVLSEGARGETREELRTILHSPPDATWIRETFRNTLHRLQGKAAATNGPEFRNYFYVYKNFTVVDEYKKVLAEHYFTQVRSVEKPDFHEFADSHASDMPAPSAVESSQSQSQSQSLAATTAAKPIEAASAPAHDAPRRVSGERMRRWAKRFLGIDLEASPSQRALSNVSAGRLHSSDVSELLSKMIVFNGLYFNGEWKTPFQLKTGDEPFYAADGRKFMTRMMYAVGEFRVGRIARLHSTAVSLPYKGERYSFVMIYADDANGTGELMRRAHQLPLGELHSSLQQRHVQISIPPFEFNSVTYLKDSLKSIGVRKIFTYEADFQGLSHDQGLFVDDVVQLVTIKVDARMAAPNFMTASSVQTRTVTEKLTVDRPFVFLVHDHKDGLVVAAGKLHVPTKKEEEEEDDDDDDDDDVNDGQKRGDDAEKVD